MFVICGMTTSTANMYDTINDGSIHWLHDKGGLRLVALLI